MSVSIRRKTHFEGRDIIGIHSFTKDDILNIIALARQLKQDPPSHVLEGCILGNCFYEPSTRTRLSFETAMYRMGGKVVGFSESGNTSASKGESLHDAMKMMEQYADLVVLRHPCEGAAQWAADSIEIPVINAGDGSHQHPTQTLLDLMSILETQGSLEEITIALVGDLCHGRTAHSLAMALAHFNARLYFVSPPALELPRSICNELRERQIKFSFHRTLEEVLSKIDIAYMTRIQRERFVDCIDYERVKNVFTLHANQLHSVRDNLKILHPLPRVNEIHPSVDQSSHAYYFEQAKNGLYIRQAILGLLMGKY